MPECYRENLGRERAKSMRDRTKDGWTEPLRDLVGRKLSNDTAQDGERSPSREGRAKEEASRRDGMVVLRDITH